MNRLYQNIIIIAAITCLAVPPAAGDVPLIEGVAPQPLGAQAARVAEALRFLGQPLTDNQQQSLNNALQETDAKKMVTGIQKTFDPLTLAYVTINPESRVKATGGAAKPIIVQNGWTVFLIKVHNRAGVTAPLMIESSNAAPIFRRSRSSSKPDNPFTPEQLRDRWLSMDTYNKPPLKPTLSGLRVEYRIVLLYSRDSGQREATLSFNVGQGTQDLGFRSDVPILFNCKPAVPVTLKVFDHDGKPTTGQFTFRDKEGRVYPARSKRMAPDFFFHDQIYRNDGETISLPPGNYEVSYTRGPEYRILKKSIAVPDADKHTETFQLIRWIHLANNDWYSGDHHIHAAGCAHYDAPAQGVDPAAMMRHIMGEDLNVGCVLSWGPCWYHQKQFFSGKLDALSKPHYLMRYDVEVSGFPSSHAGHLCLLNLEEDDFKYAQPQNFNWSYDNETGSFQGEKTERLGQWPSWNLPILQWGKKQGGVVGYSHSGAGLAVKDHSLPNYLIPPFNGIGANEYIVDVTHDACDFISSVDTPLPWELNIWYHTLNCGYQCRISGETDFPCVYGERVGLGRVYVKLDGEEPLTYQAWIEGIRDGRSYCTDGTTHLYDFEINTLGVGEKGANGKASVLDISDGDVLDISVKASALLPVEPQGGIKQRLLTHKPYWHAERARVEGTRNVAVELIVNGYPVETQEITADGSVHDLHFDYRPKQSSWIALRMFAAAHTNPIFVEIDGKPIRASKRSAQWCIDSVEQCWKSKKPRIRDHEQDAARKAYDHAREQYEQILEVSFDDTKQ
ncbi:MAG: CehA/McbA family metallohydrolase [Pirellulales bacterium]|nr:CehA/McbA family metallohydrolase [Pirellulales bacterium]